MKIGSIAIGGNQPIRVQSMTTTDTMDTMGTVEQTLRMVESGCEIVRITAPSKKEAENLANIKAELRKRGCNVPLVADIHFTPNAAEIAATIVEKVRINPGNYADKKKFEEIEYTELSYADELQRIEERFTPLVNICKEHGTAMRIGTNHGSLSDRIMSKYGDTPHGMVESAMEFIRICRKLDYHELVVSMKSSNPQVMVQAYRLLIQVMQDEGMNYPLHLGVTEAGDGEDGRIKSAVGIGTLLLDGIGDTVRVSLTEDPEFEAPVAEKLIRRFPEKDCEIRVAEPKNWLHNPTEYTRISGEEMHNFGGKEVPRVISDLSHLEYIKPASLFQLGYAYSVPLDKWNLQEICPDYIYVGQHQINFAIPGTLGIIQDLDAYSPKNQHYPIGDLNQLDTLNKIDTELFFLRLSTEDVAKGIGAIPEKAILVLQGSQSRWMPSVRWAINTIKANGINNNLVFHWTVQTANEEILQLDAASDIGALFVDGYGEGIFIQTNQAPKAILSTSFGILQATRQRISKTEYISCPSCGRTLFDLQETTAKIRKVTNHLKGLKIGIMGCIVNGPGEMADADYGYVGSGPGKINLYKEREVMKRNVPSEQAVEELINLIQDHGDWIEAEI
ncbi:MAG: (E)-4-hydroxy-3-methylbut-2-enyl-diphosphate synthase [Sphingobacteriales bacterium]